MRLGAIAIYARGGLRKPPPLRGRVKAEGGHLWIFHPVCSVYKGDIFDIWKKLFRWQGPFKSFKFIFSFWGGFSKFKIFSLGLFPKGNLLRVFWASGFRDPWEVAENVFFLSPKASSWRGLWIFWDLGTLFWDFSRFFGIDEHSMSIRWESNSLWMLVIWALKEHRLNWHWKLIVWAFDEHWLSILGIEHASEEHWPRIWRASNVHLKSIRCAFEEHQTRIGWFMVLHYG